MKRYMLDASAFMLLIKKADEENTVKCLGESVILDLTFFEVGNAVWKEGTLTKLVSEEAAKIMQAAAQTILQRMESVGYDPGSFEEIVEIAKEERITFYDSSYIHAAKLRGLQLVTEDKALRAKAEKYVKTQNTTGLLPL
jgi:predicted nucleic acid-binding protein